MPNIRLYGDMSPTQAAHSAKELLKRALPYLVLEQFGNLKPLPANSTRSIDFRRHKLPIPTDAAGFMLTEGQTPDDDVPTMESYKLDLKQYGNVLATTDVVDDTHIDDVLGEYMGMLGEHAGQVIELMRWEAIRGEAGVSVILAGSAASEANITTGLSKTELRAALRSIRANHGRPITQLVKSDVRWGTEACEPAYVAVMHSDMEGTVRETFGSSFTPVADYGSGAKILNGEFGNFENIRFISTALLGKRKNDPNAAATAGAPLLLADAGGADKVNLYDVIVFAADAWCGVALKGEYAVHPTMVNATPSDSDPLGQRRKCGYKTMQEAKVTQAAHLKKIICGALKNT